MHVMSGTVDVLAGATSANVLIGSIFEFLKRPSKIELAATVEVGAARNMTGRLSIGDTIVTDPPLRIGAEAVVMGGVVIPDNIKLVTAGAPGDRLSLTFTNADGVNDWEVDWWLRVS